MTGREIIFTAGLSYQYSFTIFDEDYRGSDEELYRMVFEGVKRQFPESIIDDGAAENEVFEQMLMNSYKITLLIENIKYILELTESELDLLYQESTNRLVNLLMMVGLALSVIQVVLGFMG